MNRSVDHLVAGLVAAVLTGVIAGVVLWRITASQREFVAGQFAAQNAKIQAVGDELAKTAGDLKRLDGALKATEATLHEVKDQVSLVGTRTGISRLDTTLKAATKTLADVKEATAPEQAKNRVETALAPLTAKLDNASKALAALQAKFDDKTRDQALAHIETAVAGVKDAIAKRPPDPELAQANAKLDDALKALAALGKTAGEIESGAGADATKLADASKLLDAIGQTLDALKTGVSGNAARLDQASKSLTALDATVKKGFSETAAAQTALKAAMAKPAPASAPPQPAKPGQDLVVFYVQIAGAAPAAASGRTSAAPPLAVHYEKIGGVDDDGQAALIANKLRGIVKGHSGCTIAVAGHADTLGSDRANYELSKKRATEVADKLKAAFAGDHIAIAQTQWGERRLKEWTPDETAREANRRVDIKVSCEK